MSSRLFKKGHPVLLINQKHIFHDLKRCSLWSKATSNFKQCAIMCFKYLVNMDARSSNVVENAIPCHSILVLLNA